MNKIIIIGTGGHAHSCIDVLESQKKYAISGLVEQNTTGKKSVLGYPILGTDNDLESLRKTYHNAVIAIGQIKNHEPRKLAYEKLKKLDFDLPTIISPHAHISSHSQIGEGTIVMHNVIINANTSIGYNCIINNKVLIEHDVKVGNHCHISTSAVINGEVIVKNKSFIGSNATVKQSIVVAEESVVGAGIFVKNNTDTKQLIK